MILLANKVLMLWLWTILRQKTSKFSRFKARLRAFLSSLLAANYSSHILLLINPSEKTEIKACEKHKKLFHLPEQPKKFEGDFSARHKDKLRFSSA